MKRRWRIRGRFETLEPLHVGSGEITECPRILDSQGLPCDVAAVVRDVHGLPCIPGTAIKGVLRAWAERFHSDEKQALESIFGTRDAGASTANAGWAEFLVARLIEPAEATRERLARHVPYWDEQRLSGIISHVCIDRQTGAARASKLFYEEFVPEGLFFDVEIDATRLTPRQIDLLVAILERGASHETHPYLFGANGSDGWGRMAWSGTQVTSRENVTKNRNGVGFECCSDPHEPRRDVSPSAPPAYLLLDIDLSFNGPMLVNDASRVRARDDEEGTNFVPLRRANGEPWLPASSFRGVLRQRAEFLLRSLDQTLGDDLRETSVDGPIVRIFGQTSEASRMRILRLEATRPCNSMTQDFVAIDRFRGGAAEGAKFNAAYLDRAEFSARVVLDLDGLEGDDFALFLRALKDVCQGEACLGWGESKGYGEASGTLRAWESCGDAPAWFPRNLSVTAFGTSTLDDWLRSMLAPLGRGQLTATGGETEQGSRTIPGTLIRRQTNNGRQTVLKYQAKRGEAVLPILEGVLPASLRGSTATEIPVDFEWRAPNQPHQIRPRGETLAVEAPALSLIPEGRFANPYYFLPAASREGFKGDMDDAAPAGHHRYLPGRYSGRIPVRLTVKTPLLICDEGEDTEVEGHRVYGVRLRDGRPFLASSSVRGMLRSAYEAITNSRFGVFPARNDPKTGLRQKNARPPGIRLPADSGLELVPVYVDKSVSGELVLKVQQGASVVSPAGVRNSLQPMYAAWCAHYGNWRPPGLGLFRHGSEAWAYLTPWHYHRDLPGGRSVDFDFWNVEELVPPSGGRPVHIPTGRRPAFGSARPTSQPAGGWHKGYLCVSQQNMTRKHDERFFFSAPPAGSPSIGPIPLSPPLVQAWRELIQDYHDQHAREITQGRTAPPALQPPLVFSRHISQSGSGRLSNVELELKAGDLCYARLQQKKGTWSAEAIYPVLISRQLSQLSALEVLPPRLRPAGAMEELSPADRVFGWVAQSEDSGGDRDVAHRSLVRVGPVRCLTEFQSAVAEFEPPKTLGNLAEPKPQQGRFYLGQADGSAQPAGRSKVDAGYSGRNRVRGPKVYPHHARRWCDVENSALSLSRNDQNRSIKAWVNPGTEFAFEIHFTNLSRWELGGLLWLLPLPSDHYMRLGLGKPLGFGSVRAEILPDEETPSASAGLLVAENSSWIESLSSGGPVASIACREIANEFECSMNAAAPGLLPAFLRCAVGFGEVPIHYPRVNGQDSTEKHFKWFVSNEKNGRQLSLPDLGNDDPTLPLLD